MKPIKIVIQSWLGLNPSPRKYPSSGPPASKINEQNFQLFVPILLLWSLYLANFFTKNAASLPLLIVECLAISILLALVHIQKKRHWFTLAENTFIIGIMVLFLFNFLPLTIGGTTFYASLIIPFFIFSIKPQKISWLLSGFFLAFALLYLYILQPGYWPQHQTHTYLATLCCFIISASYLRKIQTQYANTLQENINSHQRTIDQEQTELLFVSNYDLVTHLPNRQKLLRLLPQLTSMPYTNRLVLVLSIRIHRLAELTVTAGIHYTDTLLKRIASEIRFPQSQDLIIGRNGQDRLLALVGISSDKISEARIIKAVKQSTQHIASESLPIFLEATIGAAIYSPIQNINPATVMLWAEQTMMIAETQKIPVLFYNQKQNSHFQRFHDLINQIKEALKEEQFQFFYQAKMDVKTGKPQGLEALARWRTDENGWVSPMQFIPIIEQSTLIINFTHWGLKTGIQACKRWQAELPNVSVSINISAHVLCHTDIVQTITELLAETQLPPQLLCLEITETSLIQQPQTTLAVLDQLVKMGLTLSIDDYGEGFSSLSYLRQLPVHEVKIDKCFIQDLDQSSKSQAIVQSTIQLAHTLGLKVVAEGVETERVFQVLQTMDCDLIQGFWGCVPLPETDIKKTLDRFLTTHQGLFATRSASEITEA